MPKSVDDGGMCSNLGLFSVDLGLRKLPCYPDAGVNGESMGNNWNLERLYHKTSRDFGKLYMPYNFCCIVVGQGQS